MPFPVKLLATLPRPTHNAALPTPLGNVLPDFVRNAFRIELFTIASNPRQRPTQRNYHWPGQTFRNALYQAAYPKGQNLQHRACPAALTGASTSNYSYQKEDAVPPQQMLVNEWHVGSVFPGPSTTYFQKIFLRMSFRAFQERISQQCYGGIQG